MRTLTCGIAFLVSACVWSDDVRGQLTGIETGPPPIIAGPWTYQAKDNGPLAISTYKWEVKCLMPGAIANTYTVVGQGDASLKNISIPGSHYGPHRIRCTATYQGNMANPNPPPTSVVLDIDIVKPNKTVIVGGTNSETNGGVGDVKVTFQIKYNNQNYPYVIGWPQEYIWQTTPSVEEIDWIPKTQAELVAGVYELSGSYIIDKKRIELFPSQWTPINILAVFVDFEQQNRIVYKDCTGATQYINLTKHKLRYRKTAADKWKIEEY